MGVSANFKGLTEDKMPHDLPKAYDPTAIEDHWPATGSARTFSLFRRRPPALLRSKTRARTASPLSPSCCLRPTSPAVLHMGHMLNQTEMDILTRWRRMSGRLAWWVPGTDHAGIATQMMVERQLTEEGTLRQKLGREASRSECGHGNRHYGGATPGAATKRLGVSVDRSREYSTMDERPVRRERRGAFSSASHATGPYYRGAYIVNWRPRCQASATSSKWSTRSRATPGDSLSGAWRRRQRDGRVH